MHKVSVCTFSNGEKYPMLTHANGLPDFWVTMYVTACLRMSHTASSIENTIRNILHLKRWEAIENRDLISEITDGRLLSNEDIHSLRDHCLLEVKSLQYINKKKISNNVTEISLANPNAISTFSTVGKVHYSHRLNHIASFIEFCANAILNRHPNYKELRQEIDSCCSKLKKQASKVKVSKKNAAQRNYRAPPPEVFDKFMEIVNEKHPDNPYPKHDTRFRNAVMFELMFETGMRSGELLSLKVADLDFHASKISIKRNHDDPYDPRSRQPVAKTQERDLFLPIELTRRLETYIMEFRSKVKNANKHPFIFVSHRKGKFEGRPTTDTNFRINILGFAKSKFPDVFYEITRHGFRHNFNHILSLKIDERNRFVRENPKDAKKDGLKLISEKEEIQIRKRLNGWLSDDTAQTYTLRFVHKIADDFMMEDMKEQSGLMRGSYNNVKTQ